MIVVMYGLETNSNRLMVDIFGSSTMEMICRVR